MAYPVWPADLPAPLDGSVRYAPLFDNILKSPMEVGQKTRRRATYVPDLLTCSVVMTAAQVQELRAFLADTLKTVGGFTWLRWDDPALPAANYAFQQVPSYDRLAGSRTDAAPAGLWVASLELRTLP